MRLFSVSVAWLLKKDRIASPPLDRVDVPTSGEKTKERRALAVAQLLKLLDATRRRPVAAFVERYDQEPRDEVRKKLELRGRERALVYKTAVVTGQLFGEVAALRPCHPELAHKPFPRVEVPGRLTKNGKQAKLLLVPSFAAELGEWIAETGKAPTIYYSTSRRRASGSCRRTLNSPASRTGPARGMRISSRSG